LGISVGGGQGYGVAYLLDGAMHNNPQDNLNLPFPFPDALQEFSVATSGLNAQNGMHSGASVSAVTKSGTNRYRGSVFEFLRDRRFNATDVNHLPTIFRNSFWSCSDISRTACPRTTRSST
jgi:hypothetical protein